MTDSFYDEEMAHRQEKVASTKDMVSQRKVMLALLNLRKEEHVRDVGSGNGIFAREMVEIVGESGHVCGVDSADAMVNIAQSLCPGGTFLKGEATDLPIEESIYDAVTASQLLCFIPDVDKAISEFFRVLKPGGRLVILDSDWGSLVWNCRNKDLMDQAIALLTSPYVDAHTPRTLSRRLTEAGFKITDRQTMTVLNWEPDPDSYSQQTVGFIKAMMEDSPNFTQRDWETWAADQAEIADAGEYMFSLNRYIFTAIKP